MAVGNINGKKCRHCSRTPWVFLGALNSIFGGKWRVTWENKRGMGENWDSCRGSGFRAEDVGDQL